MVDSDGNADADTSKRIADLITAAAAVLVSEASLDDAGMADQRADRQFDVHSLPFNFQMLCQHDG
jgi:hypothetical protein